MIIPFDRRATPRTIALVAAIAAAVGGAAVAVHYHHLGLTLTHYDARGHLVVARRIIDSLTPGWQQIGAVWLPLPHLLNMLPVQIDVMYRSGASGVAISIAAFAIAAASVAWIVARLTGCASAALAAAAVFGLNPNILYLQSTPMTEPLLLALTTLAVALLIEFVDPRPSTPRPDARAQTAPPVFAEPDPGLAAAPPQDVGGGTADEEQVLVDVDAMAPRDGVGPAPAGWAFALACLTRYEAWPVTGAALLIASFGLWRRGEPLRAAARAIGAVAIYPTTAVAAFLVFSRVVIGEWFVASGFFVPENKSLGDPVLSAAEIWWGTHMLSGYFVIAVAAAGLILLLVRGIVSRRNGAHLLPLALVATAALPWAAFVKGHPFRIRYMVPLIAVEAIGAGTATALAGRWRAVAALALFLVAGYELRPLDTRAPMVVEAQWDRPNMAARDRVTDYLRANYDGTKILASMGSLGHYMQEASAGGFAIRDFLHEGNGDLWLVSIEGPQPFVGWILIEEKAEGGDVLAQRAREHPHFLDGFTRVCDGAGMALYRRTVRGEVAQRAEGRAHDR